MGARQSAHLSILSTKRVAENASQTRFTYNQRSRAFSATHFTDENAQLVGLTGEEIAQIAMIKSHAKGFALPAEILPALGAHIERVYGDGMFGNGEMQDRNADLANMLARNNEWNPNSIL